MTIMTTYEKMKQQDAERVRLIERLQKLGYWFSRQEVKEQREYEKRMAEINKEFGITTPDEIKCSGNSKVMHDCFIDTMDVTEYLRDFGNYVDDWAIKAAHSILDSLKDPEHDKYTVPFDLPYALRGFFFIDAIAKEKETA